MRPIEAKIRMKVLFRRSCDEGTRQMGCAPPSCAVPGGGGDENRCGDDCDSTDTCLPKNCEEVTNPDTGEKEFQCIVKPAAIGKECSLAGDVTCYESSCQEQTPGDPFTMRCKEDTSKPTPAGWGCSAEASGIDKGCGVCDGAGACGPLDSAPLAEKYCGDRGGECQHGLCRAGECVMTYSAGQLCSNGDCGSCVCNYNAPPTKGMLPQNCGSHTYPDSCTTEVTIADECRETSTDFFKCFPTESIPDFNRADCCGGEICVAPEAPCKFGDTCSCSLPSGCKGGE